jgi:hypothetical protein
LVVNNMLFDKFNNISLPKHILVFAWLNKLHGKIIGLVATRNSKRKTYIKKTFWMSKARKHGSTLLASIELGMVVVSDKAITTCTIDCTSTLACVIRPTNLCCKNHVQ